MLIKSGWFKIKPISLVYKQQKEGLFLISRWFKQHVFDKVTFTTNW